MTIVYTLSGIFLNHRFDFNPDYKIINTDFQTHKRPDIDINKQEIKKALRKTGKDVIYKQHFTTNHGNIKIFISNAEVVINPETGIFKEVKTEADAHNPASEHGSGDHEENEDTESAHRIISESEDSVRVVYFIEGLKIIDES